MLAVERSPLWSIILNGKQSISHKVVYVRIKCCQLEKLRMNDNPRKFGHL
jgi:hypothetical protein